MAAPSCCWQEARRQMLLTNLAIMLRSGLSRRAICRWLESWGSLPPPRQAPRARRALRVARHARAARPRQRSTRAPCRRHHARVRRRVGGPLPRDARSFSGSVGGGGGPDATRCCCRSSSAAARDCVFAAGAVQELQQHLLHDGGLWRRRAAASFAERQASARARVLLRRVLLLRVRHGRALDRAALSRGLGGLVLALALTCWFGCIACSSMPPPPPCSPSSLMWSAC